MNRFSKNLKKLTTVVIGAALLAGTAMPAAAQISSVNQLLQKVRQDASKTAADNARREAEFRKRRDQQSSKLAQARSQLGTLESKVRQVESKFAANEATISKLEGELNASLGEFRDVFGLARSKAGEFKATLDASLISAQYPDRTKVLGNIANSKALPSSDDMDAIWKSMLGEIKAQRQVTSFQAKVGNTATPDKAVGVTRVGPFDIFTTKGANFLEYKPSSDPKVLPLNMLVSQPGGAINKAASAVAGAKAGELVYAPVDPTRGNLLKALEGVPSFIERTGHLFKLGQGGPIGMIIWWLFAIGMIFGILNIVRLFLVSSSVKSQKKKAQPSKSNPLGRVMMANDSVKDKDEEIIELKLDEAILRESPKLELGLNLLKLGAAIAPLLGLLGTVTGMIKTFQAMMIYGAGDPQLMAGGISEALVTTMLGLIAAIPLLILHSFCSSMARSVQGTLEEQSAGIVARHVESRRV